MERCEVCAELISQSLDRPLTPEEQTALEAHLQTCGQCRTLRQQLGEIHAQLGLMKEQEVPGDFARGVMEEIGRLESEEKVIPLRRRPWFRTVGSLAACAVLCVGLFRILSGQLSGPAEPPVQARAAQASQEEPAVFIVEDGEEFFDEETLIADVSSALGEEPGCLAIFEEIPQALESLGSWQCDSKDRPFLVLAKEPEVFTDAIYFVRLGEGPAVCMVWP